MPHHVKTAISSIVMPDVRAQQLIAERWGSGQFGHNVRIVYMQPTGKISKALLIELHRAAGNRWSVRKFTTRPWTRRFANA
eukprot:704866-Amphidinium_carterae.1